MPVPPHEEQHPRKGDSVLGDACSTVRTLLAGLPPPRTPASGFTLIELLVVIWPDNHIIQGRALPRLVFV
jgi:hypothetical protein